jgi:hypothetical protein
MSRKSNKTNLLSNRQNTRFGGLIAVMGGREPYDPILKDLVDNGFVQVSDDRMALTEKGVREKDRLATLAGLMVEKDNAAPLPSLNRQAQSKVHNTNHPQMASE